MAKAATPATNIPDGYELTKKIGLIPDVWPGAFGAYKYSRNAIMSNFWIFVWLALLSLPVSAFSFIGDRGGLFLVSTVIYYFLVVWLNIAYYAWYLSVAQGKKLSIKELLGQAIQPKVFLNIIGLWLIAGPILFISFLLLIVPFVIIFPRVLLAMYYVLDKDMNCIDALKACWNDSKGYSGIIWGTIGASFAMLLLFITIVGIPFSIYFLIMYSAITAIVYEYIKNKGPVKSAAAQVTSA